MADTGFSLTPEELRVRGNSLKSRGATIISVLNDLSKKIMELSNYYEGPASRALLDKFNNLRPHFEEFEEAANKCGDHLINSANLKEQAEEEARAAVENNN